MVYRVSEIPFVPEETLQLARELEQRLARSRPSAGVLFVSVRPRPYLSGETPALHVTLGIIRLLEVETGEALIRHVLREEIENENLLITWTVERGVEGTGRSPPHAEARQDPA